MSLLNLIIRSATADDAEAIGELAHQLADYLRGLGDPTDFQFNSDTYLRDGFGSAPAFAGLVAEMEGEVIGYLLYHFGYDTDRAMRSLHVLDLYIRKDARRQGAGKALMQTVAHICHQAGGQELFWAVYRLNTLAAEFYTSLGARYTQDMLFMYWPAANPLPDR